MANVNLTINGRPVSVPEGRTILEAAKTAGIRIPTLCAYEGMGPHAACCRWKGRRRKNLPAP